MTPCQKAVDNLAAAVLLKGRGHDDAVVAHLVARQTFYASLVFHATRSAAKAREAWGSA